MSVSSDAAPAFCSGHRYVGRTVPQSGPAAQRASHRGGKNVAARRADSDVSRRTAGLASRQELASHGPGRRCSAGATALPGTNITGPARVADEALIEYATRADKAIRLSRRMASTLPSSFS